MLIGVPLQCAIASEVLNVGSPVFRSTLYGATTEASSNGEPWRKGLVCGSHGHTKKVRPTLRAALPSLAWPLWEEGHSLKLGLQLYALRQIRAIGYQEVGLTSLQFALPVSELRKVIENSVLTAVALH